MSTWEMSWTSERSIWVRRPEGQSCPLEADHLAKWVVVEQTPGMVRAATPTAHGVLIELDIRQSELDAAWAAVESLLECFSAQHGSQSADHRGGREVTIPVCYDERVGPDLGWVSAQLGVDREQVIAWHSGRTYRVMTMGFMPGFGYLGSVEEALRLPRRETPRTRVPSGSVAIAEEMTAVYPHQSAGGWHLIGRTPMRLFDPLRDEPAVLRLGDRVRFEPITIEAFQTLGEAEKQDRY